MKYKKVVFDIAALLLIAFVITACGGASGDQGSGASIPMPYIAITIDEPTSGPFYEVYESDVTLSGTYDTATYTAYINWVNHTTGKYGQCNVNRTISPTSWSETVPVAVGDNLIEVTVMDKYGQTDSASITITHPNYHEPYIIDFTGYGVSAHDATFQADVETGGYNDVLNIYYGTNPSLLQSSITFYVSDSPHLQSFAATVSGFTKGATYYYQSTLSGGTVGSYTISTRSFDMIVAPTVLELTCNRSGFTATINPNGYSTSVYGNGIFWFGGDQLDVFLDFGSGESPVTLSSGPIDLSKYVFLDIFVTNEGGVQERFCSLD